MIHDMQGDLLESKAAAIVHGVAPNDPFAQGLALALRERWPALYKDFRHYCQTMHPKPGELWTWMGADGVRMRPSTLITDLPPTTESAVPMMA